MKQFVRLWLILLVTYTALSLAICWIVSGSIVYPAETAAHIAIVPLLQAALVILILRKRPGSRRS